MNLFMIEVSYSDHNTYFALYEAETLSEAVKMATKDLAYEDRICEIVAAKLDKKPKLWHKLVHH